MRPAPAGSRWQARRRSVSPSALVHDDGALPTALPVPRGPQVMGDERSRQQRALENIWACRLRRACERVHPRCCTTKSGPSLTALWAVKRAAAAAHPRCQPHACSAPPPNPPRCPRRRRRPRRRPRRHLAARKCTPPAPLPPPPVIQQHPRRNDGQAAHKPPGKRGRHQEGQREAKDQARQRDGEQAGQQRYHRRRGAH